MNTAYAYLRTKLTQAAVVVSEAFDFGFGLVRSAFLIGIAGIVLGLYVAPPQGFAWEPIHAQVIPLDGALLTSIIALFAIAIFAGGIMPVLARLSASLIFCLMLWPFHALPAAFGLEGTPAIILGIGAVFTSLGMACLLALAFVPPRKSTRGSRSPLLP